MIPKKLQQKLNERKANNALRELGTSNNLIDFSSNDYLGFSNNEVVFSTAHQYLINNNNTQNGATGSRLLSGNYTLYNDVEEQLCTFHKSEAALIFNSGYNANLGFFSCVPQRDDIILYDEFIHASIRDGIKMSNAKAYKFKHNDVEDLKEKMLRFNMNNNCDKYIVTESVFSMDGDTPDLKKIAQLSKKYNAKLVVDEAHAIGVFGKNGSGLTQDINTFATIITFGKALGCHGAAILGSIALKEYLVNFSRPFIYTTGLPPHALATIKYAYQELEKTSSTKKLKQNISFFKSETQRLQLSNLSSQEQIGFIKSNSAIHCCIISGNQNIKLVANELHKNNFNVKPILSPTVKAGEERLRFCIHSYNSAQEITKVLELLSTFVNT